LKQAELGAESLKKIKNCYASVMAVALEHRYIANSNVQNLKMPKPKKGKRPRPHISPEKAAAIIEIMPEPYATMFVTAVCGGFIPSELVALREEDVLDDALVIDEKYCRGEWGPPKTEARNAAVPVPKFVIDRIRRLKTMTVRIGGGRGKYQTFKL